MKMIGSIAFTILAADIVFLITHSFLLVAITGLIGGYSWARSQRTT